MTSLFPPMTETGLQRLNKLLTTIAEVHRPRLVAAETHGTSYWDTRASAARTELAALDEWLDRVTQHLQARPLPRPGDATAQAGSTITLDFGDGAGPEERILSAVGEVPDSARPVHVDSPLGRALIGRQAGDVVLDIQPNGRRTAIALVDVAGQHPARGVAS